MNTATSLCVHFMMHVGVRQDTRCEPLWLCMRYIDRALCNLRRMYVQKQCNDVVGGNQTHPCRRHRKLSYSF